MKTTLFAIAILVLNVGSLNSVWAGSQQDCRCDSNNCRATSSKITLPTSSCTKTDTPGYTECFDTISKNVTPDWYCPMDSNATANADSTACGTDTDINTKNTSKKYGCKYGGASATTTKSLNDMTNVASTAMDKVGEMEVQSSNAGATTSLINKGASATSTDVANAQAGTLNKAGQVMQTGAIVDSGLALTQLERSREHLASIKKVTTNSNNAVSENLAKAMGLPVGSSSIHCVNGACTASVAKVTSAAISASTVAGMGGGSVSLPSYTSPNITTTDGVTHAGTTVVGGQMQAAAGLMQIAGSPAIYTTITCTTTGAASASQVASGEINCHSLPGVAGSTLPVTNAEDENSISKAYTASNKIRLDNTNAEISAQKQLASSEAMTAAGTGFKAMTQFEQASMDKNAAAAVTAGTSSFSFNPSTGGGYSGDGTAPDATPPPGENLASGDAPAGTLPGANQINPNDDNGVGGAAPAGSFTAAGPSQSPAAAATTPDTAGGTTAAKDDAANKDNTPPSKSAVGSYSAGDGPGYTRNQANGGPSVGLDNSFADMLKKFLPGDDEKKKDDAANFDDRSPASDSAAVIARNKNIFEEIHKRYEKKNTEGAIVF